MLPTLVLGLVSCRPVVPPAPPPPLLHRPQPAPPGDLVYLVMVDRFADGDPSLPGPVDPADPHGWHGGDLAGVLAHVDDLHALGVGTVWLSPIYATRDDKIGEWGAFHGYWVTGGDAINPRFGTVADLRALSDALHARGMRLVLDVVWNHTDYDAPVRTAHPDWFHANGDIQDWDDPVQRVTGDVHGLPDLAQEQPAVADWLVGMTEDWIDRAGVDGLRVDAVGHMPLPFLRDANLRLDQRYGDVWTVGEDFSGDPARLARTLDEGGFDAVFDFPLHYAMIDHFCRGAPLSRISGTLSLDRLYGPRPGDRLVTFLDNHDLPRVMSACGGAADRVDRALVLLFGLRGTPALSWGTEALVEGAEEPANRVSLPWDRADVRRDALAALQGLRAAHPALDRGQTRILHASEDLLVLGRWTDQDAALIRIHTGDGFSTWSPPQALVTGSQVVASARGTDRIAVERTVRAVPDVLACRGEGVWIDVLEPMGDSVPWADWQPVGPLRTVDVHVSGAPEGELRVVGAGPELGHWNPERGLPLRSGTVQVHLPVDTVGIFKLVLRKDEGWQWAGGPDQAITVVAGEGPQPHRAVWAPPGG